MLAEAGITCRCCRCRRCRGRTVQPQDSSSGQVAHAVAALDRSRTLMASFFLPAMEWNNRGAAWRLLDASWPPLAMPFSIRSIPLSNWSIVRRRNRGDQARAILALHGRRFAAGDVFPHRPRQPCWPGHAVSCALAALAPVPSTPLEKPASRTFFAFPRRRFARRFQPCRCNRAAHGAHALNCRRSTSLRSGRNSGLPCSGPAGRS